MVKPLNRYTSNEFHDWQRQNLPGRFVIQDLDVWAIVVSDSSRNYEPLCLIELKRSFYEPEKWSPFKNDLPNYMSLFKLSIRAKLPLTIIYFKKELPLTSANAKIAIFKIHNVTESDFEWIKFSKTIQTPDEFKKIFPNNLL